MLLEDGITIKKLRDLQRVNSRQSVKRRGETEEKLHSAIGKSSNGLQHNRGEIEGMKGEGREAGKDERVRNTKGEIRIRNEESKRYQEEERGKKTKTDSDNPRNRRKHVREFSSTICRFLIFS